MKLIFFLISIIIITYSCSPINNQHGYILEDVVSSANSLSQFNLKTTSENDILQTLGSPSIIIDDISNIWIYLVAIKKENVFKDDEPMYQYIMRYEFDNNGKLLSKEFFDEKNFTEIAFSKNKTKAFTDNFGLADQIYETFTRGQ
jgi:outer membrane protein assembly factor BamE (lipoprotein component of BamABCDE complex)